jgi:hypothetical protein
VLLEAGKIQALGKIEHELHRLEPAYAKRLADYPDLHLKLESNITAIDNDYRESGHVPPDVPGWGEVVESLTKVQDTAKDRVIEKMLKEIHKSAEAGQRKALEEYRTQTARRHKVLGGLAPAWQQTGKLLKRTEKTVSSVLDTTSKLDRHITQLEKIRKGGPGSVDLLSARVTKLFLFSLIVIAVAAGGAFINFQLIALPMSELVPAGFRILGMPVSQVAALVIVTLEIVVGIFLMEAIGITNIFPQIDAMNRTTRRIVLLVAFGGLLFLASVEASLAVLRERLVESETIVTEVLAGAPAAVAEADRSRIPMVGQAVLGFVLPWILAMVAVPLEMLIESGQFAFVKLGILLVALFGHLSRALAYLFQYTFRLLQHLYDAYIVLPAQVARMRQARKEPSTVPISERDAGKGGGA